MERKLFMGIAQIRLDSLDLGEDEEPLTGWYKLYHSSSLVLASSSSSPSQRADLSSQRTDPRDRSHRDPRDPIQTARI